MYLNIKYKKMQKIQEFRKYRVTHLAFAFWTIDNFDFNISNVIVNVSDI